MEIMGRLFEEMGRLFPDQVMHIGCDETGVVPPCTLANTKAFEVAMIRKLISLGKQPAGWEEVLFTSEAAVGFPSVVVHSWHHTHWEQVPSIPPPSLYTGTATALPTMWRAFISRVCEGHPDTGPSTQTRDNDLAATWHQK